MFSALVYCSPVASADETLSKLEDQYKDLEKEIEKNEKELSGIQSGIKSNEKKLAILEDQISDINEQISLLDEKVDVLNEDIDYLKGSISEINQNIAIIDKQIIGIEAQIEETDGLIVETRELLLARIRENYMAGDLMLLDILVSGKSISSFFMRKELVARVSESDAKLITDLTEKIEQLDVLKKQLEERKTTLESQKAELNSQKRVLDKRQDDLEDSISTQESKKKEATKKQTEVKDTIAELDKDSDAYKATIARQRREQEILSAQIDEYIRVHGSSQGDTPDEEFGNDGSMMWPVKGKTRLTATYPSYSDGSPHWGIDIVMSNGNTRGQPFYAAQGGEVIIAKNDGGWNYGFGNYCVVDHGDGTQTLYAHSDGLVVRKGQIVQKGEKLGVIGSTGNSTGPHLHFEVRVKKADGSVSRENPLNFVSKP
jgi:murein DD-endopeptidase MepM/ murein hydrolase activator NlpD